MKKWYNEEYSFEIEVTIQNGIAETEKKQEINIPARMVALLMLKGTGFVQK